MSAQSHRFFVGNLPHETTKDEILSKFEKYGTVESVEIRTKKDSCTGDPLATFSFVNIKADRESLNQSPLMVNGIKIGGRNIKVELAKESFLQRLQRERQSGSKTAAPTVPNHPQPSINQESSENFIKKSIPKKPVLSSSKSFDSKDDVTYHQTSKLPMFRGIQSQISNENESKPQVENADFKSFSKPNKSNKNSATNNRPTKRQSQSENSDILKKFESFSDVWKDDDNQDDYQSSNFSQGDSRRSFDRGDYSSSKSRQGDKRRNIDKVSDRTPFPNKAYSKESQNQPHNRNGSLAGSVSGKPVSAAEAKRLKSLDEKRQTFEQQKNAIKLALSNQSASKVNTKVVFGDDEEPEELDEKLQFQKMPGSVKGRKQNVLTLFNESDDEAAADDWKNQFEVKKQFQGEKGKKLLELQSTFNNDDRFKLDQRFYEDDGETSSKPSEKPQSKSNLSEEGVDTIEGTEGLAEEREQQLQILSSIIGQSISTTQPAVRRESKRKGMLRFDPSKPNHVQYELSKEPKEKKRKKKIDGEEDEEDDEDDEESTKPKFRREEKEPEPVSESKFYNVSDALADTLKQSKEGQSSGFSLLQMFGSTSVPAEGNEKEIVTKIEPLRKNLRHNPVLDDSSSDEEEAGPTADITADITADTNADINADIKAAGQDKAFPTSNPGIRSSHGVWQESFFMLSGDTRLKEGIEFFKVRCDRNTDKAKLAKERSEITKALSRHKRRLDNQWKRKDIIKAKPRGVSKNKVHNLNPKRRVK